MATTCMNILSRKLLHSITRNFKQPKLLSPTLFNNTKFNLIRQRTLNFSSSKMTSAMSTNNDVDAIVEEEDPLKAITLGIDKEVGETEKKTRFKKRKVVLLMSYCGQEYYGMQRNPETKTIEGELLKALLKLDYISENEFNTPQNIRFQRAARTDKSVSARGQIVSIKLPDSADIKSINAELPPEIRVFGMKRVTQGFDAKVYCCARTYSYMLPTFSFTPVTEKTTEDFRITPEVLESVREAFKIYVGNKKFHNYTSRKKPGDPSAMRIIYHFTCSDPFVRDGIEYVVLKVKGQSFMLHQIRKMIGLVIAYLRGLANLDTFTKTWDNDRIDIPRAPGLGLLLDTVHYDKYNLRYGKDGIHEALLWEDTEEEVNSFCEEFIYPVITKCENEEKSMFTWLATLPLHTYDVREQDHHDDKSAFGISFRTIIRDEEKSTITGKEVLEKLDEPYEEEETSCKKIKIDV